MNRPFFFVAAASLALSQLAGCGSDPPPKTPASDPSDGPGSAGPTTNTSGGGSSGGGKGGAGGPTIGQELGSIDQRGVETMTNKLLNGKLESTCHKQALDRLEFISGDVKMFFRIGGDGKVKYSYFEESGFGDRETEKCVLDTFAGADWPKPVAGEAEVRNGFGWSRGGDRKPDKWEAIKVTTALEKSKDVKDAVDKCKAGVSGAFKATGYVEPGELESAKPAEPPPDPKKPAGKKPDPKKPDPKKGTPAKPAAPVADAPEHGGKFKAIGMAVENKEAAEKIDCIIDALKQLPLPSPGSYVAKVHFTL